MKIIPKKWLLFGIGAFIFFLIILFVGMFSVLSGGLSNKQNDFSYSESEGKANVSPEVERYRSLVANYAKEYGIHEHVDLMLALMMQESGGRGLDPMQASESKCGRIGCITNPTESIKYGVKHFKSVLEKAKGDIKLTLQSYNFGGGFINYVMKHGGNYTKELAIEFSRMMYQKVKHTGNYSCVRPESAATGACYGDIGYVDAVLKYFVGNSTQVGEFKNSTLKLIMEEGLKYKGRPYVFGGSNPITGFDCSGLMQWMFNKGGISLPRTAQQQYNASKKISSSEAKPGDLVFFEKTYNAGVPVTHVGIYLGDNKFYNSNGSGIQYSTLSGYWKEHFYGFGRIASFN
ncbi:endopeptidase [Bacillus sp. NMCC4]|uniref:bifunctional lytic transglycosylase/C40 family peptidase n=1 Tax=Bacillus sp. NMCC4 TaxID=2108539 RepID=UPI000D03BFB9|nr:bifunctional lytic transglycosylase/C40 family peptidase [Bacillus sp. NMCC4]PRS35713.1 endopeptidase [Bacillus sp. NMCC4]